MANQVETSNEIYLNYNSPKGIFRRRLNTKAPEPLQPCCCSYFNPSAELQCFRDVSYNFCAKEVEGPPRQCTEQETNTISIVKVVVKQIVSLTLFGLMLWFFSLNFLLEESSYGDLFNCDPNSNTSIIVVDGLENVYKDQGVSFCYFKSTMVIASFVLLFPYMLETFSIVTIIWVSSINNQVLIPLADGAYVGHDAVFNEVHSRNLLVRSVASILVIFSVPYKIISISRGTDTGVSIFWLVIEMMWKFVVFMMPDVVLTAALFPVSYYVMQSSDTAEDIIVNLVALQVFAELDDAFVKLLLRPRSSVGEKIQNYISENPNALVAKYSPLQAYEMNERRHEMGIKVKNMPQMKMFHEYQGMHLMS